MTHERRLARSGFTLTRDYPAPVEKVWGAFADEQQKRSWWGAGDEAEARARLQGVRPTGTLEQDLQLTALVEEARALCGLAPLTATPPVSTDTGAGSLGTSDGSGAGSTAAPAAGSDG